MGLVVGDPDCGTSHWIMGCRVGITFAADSVGKDRHGIFFRLFEIRVCWGMLGMDGNEYDEIRRGSRLVLRDFSLADIKSF